MTTMVANNDNINVQREKARSSIAMVMTMVSFSMLFATLMLGYVAYRFTSEVWPPLGMQRASLGLPTISTVIILLSSMTYFLAETSFIQKKTSEFKAYFTLTFLLGIAFMISQMFFWKDLQASGIYVDTTVFASIIYGFTWIHAAHVVGGIIALLFLVPTWKGKREVYRSEIWLKGVGQYWHFLGLVWVILFFSIFIL